MPESSFRYCNSLRFVWKTVQVLLFVFLITFEAQAQNPEKTDTTVLDESYKLDSAYHSPQKAATLSAILPGLGQIYNKKYWKVPIVYVGFATFVFFINYNQKGYLEFKQAYIDFPDYDLDYDFPLTIEQIDRAKNSYKRYRDLSVIGTAGFYLLQIIDATVDAYLFDWNISEDLSLKLEPTMIQSPSFFSAPPGNSLAFRASISF